ncbi:MAG: hypothetical protein Fur0022_34250 [Anaerolineales bacterium]
MKFFRNPSHRTIFLIWLGWAVTMLVFPAFVTSRLEIARPDYAQEWTERETLKGSQDGKIFLNEPFLNTHVSWDSEYYLAIAVNGYEAPTINRINAVFGEEAQSGGGFWPFVVPENVAQATGISLSYAFFPFYPFVIRLVSVPLSLFGLNPIATATLAGVAVSMLGALAGMVALYELAKDELGEEGGIRTAFYLIIFPSGFFLAQVYTEGLFVGLAFWALVLLRRGRLGWAAVLAVMATFTRAVGITLAIPLLIAWLEEGEWHRLDMEWKQLYYNGIPLRPAARALLVLAPIFAFQLWRMSYYGLAFSKVEEEFFGRGLLQFGQTFFAWREAFWALTGENLQAAAYFALEWGGVLLGFFACLREFKSNREVAWFGFLVVFLSFTSGPVQGIYRYILAAPPVFLFLSRLGKHPAFDRAWTIFSVLLMGIGAMLFSFDMWTG